MGGVAKYVEPKNPAELAHAIEVFMLAEFGVTASGGCNEHGGDMDYDLVDEPATILVLSAEQALEINHMDRLWEGHKLEWLDEDEQRLIEVHRAGGVRPITPHEAALISPN